MFDEMFGDSLQNLEECEKSIEGTKIESPFILASDLDWNNPEQVQDIMSTFDEANELGAEPSKIRRV